MVADVMLVYSALSDGVGSIVGEETIAKPGNVTLVTSFVTCIVKDGLLGNREFLFESTALPLVPSSGLLTGEGDAAAEDGG